MSILTDSFRDAAFLQKCRSVLKKGYGLDSVIKISRKHRTNSNKGHASNRIQLRFDSLLNLRPFKFLIVIFVFWALVEIPRIVYISYVFIEDLPNRLYLSAGLLGDLIIVLMFLTTYYLYYTSLKIRKNFIAEVKNGCITAPILPSYMKTQRTHDKLEEFKLDFIERKLLPIYDNAISLAFDIRYLSAVFWVAFFLVFMILLSHYPFPIPTQLGIPHEIQNIMNSYNLVIVSIIWGIVGTFFWSVGISILAIIALFQWRVVDFRPERTLKNSFKGTIIDFQKYTILISVILSYMIAYTSYTGFFKPAGVTLSANPHTFAEIFPIVATFILLLVIFFSLMSIHEGMHYSKEVKLKKLEESVKEIEEDNLEEQHHLIYDRTLRQIEAISSQSDWPLQGQIVVVYIGALILPFLTVLISLGIL